MEHTLQITQHLKILITGGSGFIGKNLTLNLLDKNFTIYTVLNNKKQNKELSLKLKKKYKNFTNSLKYIKPQTNVYKRLKQDTEISTYNYNLTVR